MRCIFTVMHRLQTNATTTGARRSKGYTNLANLANLAEREESSRLYLSTFELMKINNLSITLLATIFPHPSLTLACSITSCSQGLSSFSREEERPWELRLVRGLFYRARDFSSLQLTLLIDHLS